MHVGNWQHTLTANADKQRCVSFVHMQKIYLFTASSEGLAQPLFGEMCRNETKNVICISV